MNVYNPLSEKSVEGGIFLAGGISNCPDWQSEMVKLLKTRNVELNIFNPRRDQFDFSSEKESEFQIEWEYTHLNMCKYIMYWFPKESICPIVLYELGRYIMDGNKHIFIGVEKGYPRSYDVYKQMKLTRPDIEIVDDLEKLADQIKNHAT
jgi:Nucleoside 2-deoxyribosyltransferase like